MSTLAENINRAINDFDTIKTAIENKGIEIGDIPTNQYGVKILEIQGTQKPVIVLNGEKVMNIEWGNSYIEQGAKAYNSEGEEIEVTFEGEVDETTVGNYSIKYQAIDGNGICAERIRVVNIVDSLKPVINIKETFQKLEAGTEYKKLDAVVTDNYDENIEVTVDTSKLNMRKVGIYTVTYNAVDTSGNEATPVIITVEVVDNTAPTIEFANADDATQIYTRGESYTIPEFIVTDNVDEEATIVRDGIIDSSKPGKYVVNYHAVDNSGNVSNTVTVNVTVLNYPPVITYMRNGTKTIIQPGKEYPFYLEVCFNGSGKLENLDTKEVLESFESGTILTDGNYSVTATLEDGATSTVRFSINTKGPTVNLKNDVIYQSPVTVQVENPETVVRASLWNSTTGKLACEGIDNVNGFILQEQGINTYTITLEDSEGRVTNLYGITVYIK